MKQPFEFPPHQITLDLSTPAQAYDQAYLESFVRMFEDFILRLESVFTENPHIQSVCPLQPDDMAGFMGAPEFYYETHDGNIYETTTSLDAMVDDWDCAQHPAVNAFFTACHDVSLVRSNFVQSRADLIQRASSGLPFSSTLQQQWSHSFESALRARDLQQHIAPRADQPASARKPGM